MERSGIRGSHLVIRIVGRSPEIPKSESSETCCFAFIFETSSESYKTLVRFIFGVDAGIICLSAKSLEGCNRSALAGGNDGAPDSAHSIVYSAPPYP